MIPWLLSFIVDHVVSFAVDQGWLGGIAALGSAVVGFFSRGVWRWLLLAITVAAIGFWIMGLKLTIAHRDTTIVGLEGNLRAADRDRDTAMGVAVANFDAFDAERRQCRAGYAELHRLLAAARAAIVARESVHVAAQACSGVPPAGRVIAQRVRERDAAAALADGSAAR